MKIFFFYASVINRLFNLIKKKKKTAKLLQKAYIYYNIVAQREKPPM